MIKVTYFCHHFTLQNSNSFSYCFSYVFVLFMFLILQFEEVGKRPWVMKTVQYKLFGWFFCKIRPPMRNTLFSYICVSWIWLYYFVAFMSYLNLDLMNATCYWIWICWLEFMWFGHRYQKQKLFLIKTRCFVPKGTGLLVYSIFQLLCIEFH